MVKIYIVEGDITKINTDAIVNAANNTLLGGGGVDGAIHKAGGKSILDECKRIGGCPTGEARLTTAGNLNSRYVIHTVGPIYEDGNKREAVLLENAYRNSIKLANEYSLKSLSFPFISAGVYGYPKKEAAEIAYKTIAEESKNTSLEKIYLVLYGQENYNIFKTVESKYRG